MPSLILELQADAMSPAVRVSDLLRKAKAVSKKLRASEIEEWLECELSGYPKAADVPEYRRTHGELRCFNPVRGWMPLLFKGDPKIQEIFSSAPMTQPVSELEALTTSGPDGTLIRHFTPAQTQQMMSQMEYPFQPGMEISKSAVLAIVDAVRTRVLDWAPELEANGVLGEGMTFSSQERSAASQVTHQYITNIGTMTGSQIQQNSSGSSQSIAQGIDAVALVALVDEIAANVGEMKLAADAREEMIAELDTLRAQAASPKPKKRIIAESLGSVRRILEEAAGNALATYAPQIAALLSAIPS